MELFAEQDEAYRKAMIGTTPVKIAIEAGIRQGWDHLIGSDGIFIGMTGFGASGKIEDLYPHFGITADAAAAAVQKRLAA
jgi:transketolase